MGGVPGNMGSQVGNIDADIREQEVSSVIFGFKNHDF